MPLPPRPRLAPRRRRGRTAGALAALLALAAVSTAAAPGVITLKRGDTLSHLAQRYGTTVSALKAANGLSGDRIYAGASLRVPSTGTTAGSPSTGGGAAGAAARDRATLATRAAPSRAAVQSLIASTARRYGVDPALAQAVAYQESGFQQRVVSGVGAIGVMQVLPSTGRALSAQTGRQLDLLKAEDNITAGVLLLRQLLRSEDTEDAALAGYYQGVGSIAAKGILPQTRAYLASIDALKPRFGGR
ncbi:MAG TPA: transglycosylase SLT domain-containing protein [Mycobacteriales bacterium]|jgi:soluble lytic murein transglycosylase-like protein|nr:transglycosylase SLT domain-containing protein [Mycobacteriales bacterium]